MQKGCAVLSAEQLENRRAVVSDSALLQALANRVRGRVSRVLREMPPVPRVKAMLSRDGGICPTDGSSLIFDPWSPSAHRCPTCGQVVTGERHDRHWARAQHLWLAERAADLAALAVLLGDEAAALRAGELLAAQAAVYLELPNQDNVLGPTHLFFSTYLESMWITSWLAAAFLLREAGLLADERTEAIDQVAEEAAALIGEFNEGLSNRQTWNAAALVAIAAWFGDEELVQTSVESRTGLLGLLADGFEGGEGMWWEGENYHLFALRGMMTGIQWARVNGVDLLEDPELRTHFERALLAPSLTALPDLTFPARKDSRFGVSLAQPAYLELWEIGRSWLGEGTLLNGWLQALYRVPAPKPDHYDAWLHDSGLESPIRRSAADLSWWALLAVEPRPHPDDAAMAAASCFIESQGLALLRPNGSYVSLECGTAGGGHGHPDRLNLTLHAGGVHWLPDPGTGSYVDPSLFWYRSVWAHNAPAVDGASPLEARCEAFDSRGNWGWARGRAGEVTRTVVAGPELVFDLVELEARTARTLELPWHLQGETRVASPGTWTAAELVDQSVESVESVGSVESVEKFRPSGSGPVVIEAGAGDARIRLHLAGGAELLRAAGPGLPRERTSPTFYLQRITSTSTHLVTLIELVPVDGTELTVKQDGVSVRRTGSLTSLGFTASGGAQVVTPEGRLDLGGVRLAPATPTHLFRDHPSWDAVALALPAWSRPALDGSLEGFDLEEPITLEGEHQYRRSEHPYDPDRFAADAWVNWNMEGLYLGVHVRKPEVVVRQAGAPPLELDNEPDDIHLDGIQLYLRWPDNQVAAFVIVPDPSGAVRARRIGPEGEAQVTGAWSETDDGYLMSVAVTDPRLAGLRPGIRLGFDLLINEMTSDRVRRLGQLVWSGGDGWVYLLGDRQNPERFGVLELK
ncbi:MAG TPA: heparinase II/III family protein [Gemmatimonadales bacterium]